MFKAKQKVICIAYAGYGNITNKVIKLPFTKNEILEVSETTRDEAGFYVKISGYETPWINSQFFRPAKTYVSASFEILQKFMPQVERADILVPQKTSVTNN